MFGGNTSDLLILIYTVRSAETIFGKEFSGKFTKKKSNEKRSTWDNTLDNNKQH